MRLNKFLVIWMLGFAFLTSCSSDDNSKETTSVNDFVWKGLNSWYYWKKDVPKLADNAFSSQSDYEQFINSMSPDKLFYSLLYDYPNVDRNSWIVDDVNKLLERFSGIDKSNGMDLTLGRTDDNSNDVLGVVNYVIPNSPADMKGIKRGYIILGVNGKKMTVDNYKELFADRVNISYADEVRRNSNGELEVVGEIKQVDLQAVELEENPIAFTHVYKDHGKKIGYLVFNGFKANYNDELNQVFSEFKTEGITDLILDLRYNGGGSLETALALGQMITGDYTGKPYVYMDFNNNHNNYDETGKLSTEMNVYQFINGRNTKVGTEEVNSVGLHKVYILTSRGTASASELTIVGLKPYIDVITIGEETYGKFVGSITLFDSPASDYTSFENRNQSHKWAMQPIVFAYYNANKDAHPAKGILPTYETSTIGLKEFGIIEADPALKEAYQLITGSSNATNRVNGYDESRSIDLESFTNSTLETPHGTELYIEPK